MQLITLRLGTVTISSMMINNIVSLVMVQIISNLGGSSDSFSAVTVIHLLFISIRFGVGIVLVYRFVAHPILIKILRSKDKLLRFIYTP
jgi:Kef-type K+ transport system membrane component KefB